jgi:hypothetical protein
MGVGPGEATYWGIDFGQRTREGHLDRAAESSGATRCARRRSFRPRYGMESKSQKSQQNGLFRNSSSTFVLGRPSALFLSGKRPNRTI